MGVSEGLVLVTANDQPPGAESYTTLTAFIATFCNVLEVTLPAPEPLVSKDNRISSINPIIL
tara:strand:- start:3784 stop:3969 length:186 start_codon:yes stop_codon:yes gene_type:complete